MKKNNLLGILAASSILAGCATTNPTTPQGQLTQYGVAAQKVLEMRERPKQFEDNPFNYTVEDMTNAFASGCFRYALPINQIQRLQAIQHDSELFPQRFVETISPFKEDGNRLDNIMFCYAARQVENEARAWRYRSSITEPISAAIWATILKNHFSSGKEEETRRFGPGGSDHVIGDGTCPPGGC